MGGLHTRTVGQYIAALPLTPCYDTALFQR